MRTFILILALSSIAMTRVFTHKISDEGVMMTATIKYEPMIFEAAANYENPFAGGSAGKCKTGEEFKTGKDTEGKDVGMCVVTGANIKTDANCPAVPSGVKAIAKALPDENDDK